MTTILVKKIFIPKVLEIQLIAKFGFCQFLQILFDDFKDIFDIVALKQKTANALEQAKRCEI